MRNLFRNLFVIILAAAMPWQAVGSTDSFDHAKTALRLQWPRNPIRIAISDSLTRDNLNIKVGSDIDGAIGRSIAAWESVGNIRFERASSPRSNVSPAGASGDGVSLVTIAPTAENVLFFGNQLLDVPAATRIFFDRNGVITEADIVLSPFHQFSTDGTFGTFDLETVLVHELGHLLGLEHSMISGTAMHENVPKNGLYSMATFAGRSLAELDRALLLETYGPKAGEELCCGELEVRATSARSRLQPTGSIWLEEAETGRIFAARNADSSGYANFGGLAEGSYKAFWRDAQIAKPQIGDQFLGDVSIDNDERAILRRSLKRSDTAAQLQFVGLNGQLSKVAVGLNPGRTVTLYLGGRNLDPRAIIVGATSPFFNVVKESLRALDYGDRLSVVSFELESTADALPGTYSIYVEDRSGARSYFPGAIVVLPASNPLQK